MQSHRSGGAVFLKRQFAAFIVFIGLFVIAIVRIFVRKHGKQKYRDSTWGV